MLSHRPEGDVRDIFQQLQHEKKTKSLIAGKMKDAYAVTEAEAGSDPSGIATTAERTDGGFRLNGE